MKKIKSFFGLHRLFVSVCVLFCCAVLSVAIALSGTAFADEIVNAQPHEAVEAQPLKPYNSIEVTVSGELAVYRGITTVADIKSDITVTGTYSGGTQRVVLADSEFSIISGSEVLADGELLVADDEDISAVQLYVESGSASLEQIPTLTVKSSDDIPTYSALTLKNAPSAIESDHTAETLKKLLSVCGDGKEIANKELYTVEVATPLTAGSTATVTVTYNNAITENFTFDVIASEFKGIFVTLNENLVLSDGYYKINEKIEGTDSLLSAFVRGMTSTTMERNGGAWKRFSVYKQYSNSREIIKNEGDLSVASLNTDSGLITLTWKPAGETNSYSDSVTVSFETQRLVAIASVTLKNQTTLYSYTDLGVSDFNITAILNSGESSNIISDAEFSVDSSLVRLNENLYTNESGESVYDKKVKISYKADASVYKEIALTGVIDAGEYTFDSIGGTPVTQKVGKDFDFRGLYVNITYTDTTPNKYALIKLDEIKDKFKDPGSGYAVEFYTNRGGNGTPVNREGDIVIPNREVLVAVIKAGGCASNPITISIDPLTLDTPVVDKRDINFTAGVYKSVTGLTLVKNEGGKTVSALPVSMRVSITEDSNVTPIATATYSPNSEPTVTNSDNSGVIYSADGKIEFTRGGLFTVTFELTDTYGDYGWISDSGYVYKLEYKDIRVNKGELDVRITDSDGSEIHEIEIEYGTEEEMLAEIAKLNLGVQYYTYGGTPVTDPELTDPEFKFYGFDDFTYINLSQNLPQDAGNSYYMVAVSAATGAYKSSTTLSEHVVSLVIKPKKINPDDVAKSQVYNRSKQYDLTKDIVVIPDDLFLEKDKPASGEIVTITTPLTNRTVKHAGKYEITLTILSTNYVWGVDGASLNASGYSEITTHFEITQYVTPDFTVTDANDFTYGENGFTPAYSLPDDFYPEVAENPEYYTYEYFYPLIQDANGATVVPDVSNAVTGDMSGWDAGVYYVFYRTAVNSNAEYGETAADYTLPTAYAEFNVLRKYVGNVGVTAADGFGGVYDSANHNYLITIGGADFVSIGSSLGIKYTVSGVNSENGNISVTQTTDGSFELKNAGTYTVSFTGLNRNYTWDNDDNLPLAAESENPDYSVNVIIKAHTLNIVWEDTDFKYDGTEQIPSATLDFYSADSETQFATKLYKKDSSGNYEAVQSAIEFGEYKIVIVSVDSTDYVISGGNEKLFTISKATLELPGADIFDGQGKVAFNVENDKITLTATYCGEIFSVEAYFDNYNNNVSVEISLGGDYSAEIKNAGGYTVTLTPSNNYVWSDNTADSVTIQFTVLQKEVKLNFTVTENGNTYVYNGGEFKPSVTLGGIETGDTVTAVTEITNGGEEKSAINAGNYTITVTGFLGTGHENYKLPEVKSCDFEILKKGIAAPALTTGAIEFGDSGDSLKFAENSVWAAIYGKANTEVTFTEFTDYNNYTRSDGASNAFTVTENGFGFAYTDAGIYEVTFTLTDGDNYRWGENGSSVNTETAIEITVNRKQISISGFATRQFAWQEDGTQDSFDFDGVTISGTTADLQLVKRYGIVTVNGTSIERDYGDMTETPYMTEKGVYYAHYTLAKSDTADGSAQNNPYNYIWDASSVRLAQTEDNAPLINMLGGYDEHVIIRADNGALVVHYTISPSILKVTVAINGYTYGDNNDSEFLSKQFTASGDELSTLQTENDAGRFTVTVSVYGGENYNDKIGEFTYDSANKNITDENASALENHLPWNAGDYRAVFVWKFKDESNYVMANSQCDFTVSPFVLTNEYITWAGEANPVYNGGTHTLTAAVDTDASGLPKRGGEKPDITSLTVALSDKGDLPTDVLYNKDNAVAAHTLYVTGISGNDAANFTVCNSSGDFAAYASLTITPRTVYVTGQSVESHVYGEDITELEKQWAYTHSDDDTKKFCDNGNYVTVEIYDNDNKEITSSLTPVGTYRVVPGLIKEYGNYTLSVTEGDFKVTQREITVTADGKTSVYGEDIAELTYTVGGKGIANGETYSNVFTLAAKNDGSAISNATGIGSYAIELIAGASCGNYNITYTGADYEITPATLKVQVDFEIYFGEKAPDAENYKNASMFTVTGFKFEDESSFDIVNVIDSFTYTTEGYEVGYKADNYTINFTAENTKWGNYVFENKSGILTVKELPLTLTIQNVSRDYYTEYTAPTVSLVVKAGTAASYAGKTLAIPDGVSESDIVSLINSELKTDGDNIVTNSTGAYYVTCEYKGDASDRYYVENITSARGEYKIISASFDNVVIPSAATLTYAETNLSVLSGEITASASDGKEDSVNIEYTLTDSLNAELYSGTAVPTVFHAGNYTLTYRIYDARGNYAEISGTITINVGTGTNAFADNNEFAYTVSGEVLTADSATEGMAAAWTYGDYNTSKVNSDGFKSPSANFDSEGAQKLNISVYFSYTYNGFTDTALYSADIDNKNGDIVSVMNGVFELNKFGAGYYKVVYALSGYLNKYGENDYNDVSGAKYLYVSKAELSVKADDANPTEYGDMYEFTLSEYGDNHTTTVEGFAYYGTDYADGRADLKNNGAAVTFTWTVADYTATSDTGEYAIVIDSKNNYVSDNYTFTFPAGGTLTVTKRVVAITVNDSSCDFNTNISLDEAVSFTYRRLTAGKESDADVFVDGCPIKLVTDALTPSGVAGDYCVYTNNAGAYPIYAVWSDSASGTGYAENYTIVFTDCTMISSDSGAIKQSADYITAYGEFNAGTFTVNSAVLSNVEMSSTVVTYNAKPQALTAQARISDTVVIDFVASYALCKQNADGSYSVVGEESATAPTDAGVYAVKLTFTSTSSTHNYSAGDLNVRFVINKQKLFVSIDNLVEIQYGTHLPLDYSALNSADGYSGINLRYNIASGSGETTTQSELISQENNGGEKKIDFDNLAFTSEYTVTSHANSVLDITLGGIYAKNYDLEYTGNKIQVLQREITVTVHGAAQGVDEAKKVYDGKDESYAFAALFENGNVTLNRLNAFFTPQIGWNGESGDALTALGLKLKLNTETKNAGKYYLTAEYNNSDYKITWSNIYDGENGETAAYYLIEQKELTLSVVGYGSTDSDKTPVGNPQIIYGDMPVFTYDLSGWIDGESDYNVKPINNTVLGGVIVDGEPFENYVIWTHNAGTYKVKYDESATTLEYTNYYVTVAECEYTIIESPVTVTPSNKTFTYADGNAIEPQITLGYRFTVSAADAEAFEANYRAKVVLTYEVKEGGTLDSNGKPQTAGTYYVHVALIDNEHGNYRIENPQFEITVNKKDIEIAWSKTSLSLNSGEDRLRTIDAFNSMIMRIEYFRYYDWQEKEDNLLSFVEDSTVGIQYTPNVAGRYEIRIVLTDTHNYTLSNAASDPDGRDKTAVILTLRVTSDSKSMTVSIDGWVYGEAAGRPVATPENPELAGTVSFLYVKTNKTSLDSINSGYLVCFDDSKHTTAELGEYLSYFGVSGLSAFKADIPTDAGIYLLRAYANGTGQNAFIPFEVSKKQIALPEFAGRTDTYTGNRLEYVISLDDEQSRAVTVYAECGVSAESGKTVLYTVNAHEAGYSVTFGLVSTNYVWADGKLAGTSLPVTSQNKWIISKAADVIEFGKESYSSTYGDSYTVEATAAFGGQINYKYAERTGENAPDVNDSVWSASKPEYAGDYWVLAFTSDTANYKGADKAAKLTVNKKTLTATAYGSMVYLDEFNPAGGAGYGYTLEGFIPGQYATTVTPVTNNVTYVLGSDFKNEAGTYSLKLLLADGEVAGLVYLNYKVVLSDKDGTFTVTPKTVHITVNNRSTHYNEPLNKSLEGITWDSDDIRDITDLGLTLSLIGESSEHPNAGNYNITATCANKNYIVSVTSGVYTVLARPLKIDLTGNITANAGSDYTINSSLFTLYDTLKNNEQLDRTLYYDLYSGLRFTYMLNNTVISKPTEMGTYVIYVTLDISDPVNYGILNGGGTFTFTVGKHAVNGSLITVESATYVNGKLMPVIDFGEYENIKDIFEFSEVAGYDYTTVGTHIFELTIKPSAFGEYKWLSIDTESRTFTFVIERGNNELMSFTASGWTYGDAPVVPMAEMKFGGSESLVFTYYRKEGGVYVPLAGAPSDAGTYYVKVTAPESQNWYAYTSDGYVEFTIEQLGIDAPVLGITAGVNDTYTGDFLWAQVSGFNARGMQIAYDGVSNISGNVLMVQAFNAGEYVITFCLTDSNYKWNDNGNAFDADGNVTVTWIVARQKIAKPTANGKNFIVNGKVLEYLPVGFDSSVMEIEGNKYGYGGTFTATVKLLDTVNYEWEDGSDGAIEFTWKITGVNTVFVAVMSLLGGLTGAGAIAAAVLYVLYRRKKRIEFEQTSGGEV